SLLSFRQDWRGSEDQALQPVRQQAQLCVRADLVEPVDDVLDNPAIRPGRYHQLLCCVVVRRRFAMYRRFFFSWHLRDDFSEKYARARDARSDRMAAEMLEIADETENDTVLVTNKDGSAYERTDHARVSRAALRVDTRKWLMARMSPRKYGDR